MRLIRIATLAIVAAAVSLAAPAAAQDNAEVLAKQLANPVASLISAPLHLKWDGDKYLLNIQPFLSYTTPQAWAFTVNSESTYDWERSSWSVPVNVLASNVVKLGGQLASVGGGLRYWVDSPDSGPEGFGLWFVFTLLFPR
jgi:hypothetical protein